MKLYRFTARSYVNGRIVEPGESMLLGDDVVPSAHMVDVAAESEAGERGEVLEQPAERSVPGAIFRSDLAYDITKSGGVPFYENPLSAASAPAQPVSEPASDPAPAAEPVADAPVIDAAAPAGEQASGVSVSEPTAEAAPAPPAEDAPIEG